MLPPWLEAACRLALTISACSLGVGRLPGLRCPSPPGGAPCLMASGLHPTPHRVSADHAAVPAQQPRCCGQWHKDCAGTAQGLACTAGALRLLHAQSRIQGRHLRDVDSSYGARSADGPPQRARLR
jgi:hypothetical protein